MRQFTAPPAMQATRRGAVLVALGVAATAMVALHLLQPELDPVSQPVSFYVWGRHGWLLPTALGAFGFALIALAGARATTGAASLNRSLTLASAALLLLAAAVPSDRWFPWEQPPTLSGLMHAAAAMIAPPLLLWPMMRQPPPRHERRRRILIVSVYCAALMTSAASLALGFFRDTSPPAIGLLERVLALAALLWALAVSRETPRE